MAATEVEAPKAEAPKIAAAEVEAPKAEAPKTEAPKAEVPKAEAPKAEVPKAEAPKMAATEVEAPKAEAPKMAAAEVEVPKAEAPKVEANKYRAWTWRVQNIPSNITASKLGACFHVDDRQYIKVKSLVPGPDSYDNGGKQTATILFSPLSEASPRIIEGVEEFEDIELDKDFIGFTPLNAPVDDVRAE